MLKPRLTATDTRAVKPAKPPALVTVEEDFYALLDRPVRRRTKVMIFRAPDIPDRVRCCNPRCKGGGLDLQRVMYFQGPGDHMLACDGREGATKAAPTCDNHWNVTVMIKGQRVRR